MGSVFLKKLFYSKIVVVPQQEQELIGIIEGVQKDVAEFDQLLASVDLKKNVQLCLQPVSVSPKATQICLDVVQERGWRLSVQMHKFLELP